MRIHILAALAAMMITACGTSEQTTGQEPGKSPDPTPISVGIGEVCGGFAGAVCTGDTTYCATPPGSCSASAGTCEEKPQFCTREYSPVCGCDGKTYGNACTAAAAGANIDYDGECEA